MKFALIPLLLLAGFACQNGSNADAALMRIEIPYNASTVFGKSEGEDGAIERSFQLRNETFALEQRGRRLEFDMREFPGDLFVAHQSRLTLPLSYEFPDGTQMKWSRGKVQVGDTKVKEPKKGNYRWNRELGAFESLESDD